MGRKGSGTLLGGGSSHLKSADRGSAAQIEIGPQIAPNRSKYRNVRTMVGGEVFDSNREAQQWVLLTARVQLGEISGLQRQVPFALWAPSNASTSHVQVSTYIADFTYYDRDGRRHVVDAKGKRTQMYALKKKWLELQDGIVIEEV